MTRKPTEKRKAVLLQNPLADTLSAAALLIVFYLLEAHFIVLGAALGILFGTYAQQVGLGRRFRRWVLERF